MTVLLLEVVVLNIFCKWAHSYVGWFLAFVDDIIGDGLSDLFVGVFFDIFFGFIVFMGVVHGFVGESGFVSFTVSVLWSGMILYSGRADLGWCVVGVGDVNGDG